MYTSCILGLHIPCYLKKKEFENMSTISLLHAYFEFEFPIKIIFLLQSSIYSKQSILWFSLHGLESESYLPTRRFVLLSSNTRLSIELSKHKDAPLLKRWWIKLCMSLTLADFRYLLKKKKGSLALFYCTVGCCKCLELLEFILSLCS